MSSDTVIQPAFRISLIGAWVAFDPANPFAGDGADLAAARADLVAAGLVIPAMPPGSRLLLAATLTHPSGEEGDEALPLFASVVILEQTGTVKTKLTDAGEIIPIRKVRRRTFEWPSGDVGKVSFHEVSYTVPYPDGPTFVTVVFSTPNLPHVDELEWLFDSIVATAEWVDPAG